MRIRDVGIVHTRASHLLTTTVHSAYVFVVLSRVIGTAVHADIVQLTKILTAITTTPELTEAFDRLLDLRLIGVERHYYG